MTTAVRRRAAARFRLGGRLVLATLAVLLVAVPFTALLLLVRAANPGLAAIDQGVAADLHRFLRGRPALEASMHVVALLTQPFLLRAIALVAVIRLWRRDRQRVAIWLGVTMIVGGTLGGVLKLLVARSRPAFEDPLATAAGYSFPSGHALNAMLAAGCLVVLLHPATRGGRRAAVWAGATALVLVTGFNRVVLGVHYLSDVLAGWTVGLATVLATVAAFALWRRDEGLPPGDPEHGLDPGPRDES